MEHLEPQERLHRSIQSSYRQLRQYRVGVRRLNEAYAGPMYGAEASNSEDDTRPEKYINLMKQAVSAHIMLLASNNPQVLASSHRLELRPFAKKYQFALNNLLEEINFSQTLNQWVRDAFFWMGIVRVHMADSGRVVHEGDVYMDPGIPFVSNIGLDDFFFDVNAKKWSECRYMGDIYRVSVDAVQNSGIYHGDQIDELQSTTKHNASDERLQTLSTGWELNDDELEPMCDLADVWLPREKVVRTFIVKQRGSESLMLHGDPIGEIEWEGGEMGPYKRMHFDEVSDNVMPLSTAADLYPLDKLTNNLFRKNSHKAKRRKEIHLYPPSAEDDANRMKAASDGDFVQTNAPGEINTVATGGVDPGLQGFALNAIELFDRMSGNLPAILGLGASSGTVGQERIIDEGANGRMSMLQGFVQQPLNGVMKDLGFLLWNDPYTEIPHREEVEGLPGFSYDASWLPGDRQGDMSEYKISVDVYSLQSQGPAQRMAAINKLLGELYIPLLPMIQQQGGTIDFPQLVKMHADMLNIPRLNQIVTFNSPMQESSPEGGPSKPPTSTRNYNRNSSSGNQGGAPDAAEWLGQTVEN